jgi:ABC-type branched-subunit amino acid transport system substrate-binding protein
MTKRQTPLTRRHLLGGFTWFALAPWATGSFAAKELVVGQVASLSGSNGADLGQGLKAGVEACFLAANASGGVRGQPLRLVSKDDRYLPEETVNLTRELIAQERPVALIAYRGTANTLALIKSEVLVKQGITLVGTLTGAKEVQGAPGVLNLRTSYERELTELVGQVQRMALDSVAALYVDDAFGRTGLAAVEQAAASAGSKLLAKVPYDKTPAKVDASVYDAAKQLAAAGAKAVILVAVGDPVYAFIKAFRPLNTASRVFCMSVVDPAAVVKRCGLELASGIGFSQVYPFPYSEKTNLVRDYRRALSKLPNAPEPNYFSLEGYVYARVLVEALKRAPDSPSDVQVSNALINLPAMDLGGLRMQIDPRTRNGMRYTDLTVLTREGKLVG